MPTLEWIGKDKVINHPPSRKNCNISLMLQLFTLVFTPGDYVALTS